MKQDIQTRNTENGKIISIGNGNLTDIDNKLYLIFWNFFEHIKRLYNGRLALEEFFISKQSVDKVGDLKNDGYEYFGFYMKEYKVIILSEIKHCKDIIYLMSHELAHLIIDQTNIETQETHDDIFYIVEGVVLEEFAKFMIGRKRNERLLVLDILEAAMSRKTNNKNKVKAQ
jgi:hypothetical protein